MPLLAPADVAPLATRRSDLPAVVVPDETTCSPGLGMWMHTGRNAHAALAPSRWDAFTDDPDPWLREPARAAVRRGWRGVPIGATIAVDTETPGTHDQLRIKCVTVAWHEADGSLHSALLDPERRDFDGMILGGVLDRAAEWVLHNGSFDVPGLVTHGWAHPDQVREKLRDTLVLARMIDTSGLGSRSLEAQAKRYLRIEAAEGGMKPVFRAAGYASAEDGWRLMDIDRPTYRRGAMTDTGVTLRLWPLLLAAAVKWTLGHRYGDLGAQTRDEALAIVMRSQRVHAIMGARTGLGIAVDRDYLDDYRDRAQGPYQLARAELEAAGVERPGNGDDLMAALERTGQLPAGWPRTAGRKDKTTGAVVPGSQKLSSTKKNLELLPDIPIVAAHRAVKDHDRIVDQYMRKADDQSAVTGRCYPMAGIHGAAASGRMSYSGLELQQFPHDARGILIPDSGQFGSADLSSIEPVTLGLLGRAPAFTAPYFAGGDIYYPIVDALGLAVLLGVDRKAARKVSKIVLLGIMYGMGNLKLAVQLGLFNDDGTPDIARATELRTLVLDYLGPVAGFVRMVAMRAEQFGHIVTVGGRVLSMPRFTEDDGSESVGAYKGLNYCIQGSAYDQLAQAVLTLDDAGLSHHIVLAIHDELVVEAEALEATREALIRPHTGFARWTRDPVPDLRSDVEISERWIKPD